MKMKKKILGHFFGRSHLLANRKKKQNANIFICKRKNNPTTTKKITIKTEKLSEKVQLKADMAQENDEQK